MRVLDSDSLHRTVKLEMDEGRAGSPEEASEIAGRYVLQIAVGENALSSPTRQATLLTAVNAGRRAFLGGVRVHIPRDGPTAVRWARGMTLTEGVESYGGTLVQSLDDENPTIVIGTLADAPVGSIILRPTWEAWSGGVVEHESDRLPESTEFPLVGVLAAAFALSEAFQHVRRYAPAGRRAAGLSLWRPDVSWQQESAFGKRCESLPASLWLLGLGHLGQGYAWAVGFLHYESASDIEVMLQDFDRVVQANESTGMLCDSSDRDEMKTRVVSRQLEDIGIRTKITERRFDNATKRDRNEPGIALAGFDDPAPRRFLEGANFQTIVDAGLGGGRRDYLDILVQAFPSGLLAIETWPEHRPVRPSTRPSQPAYEELGRRLAEDQSLDEGDIECGLLRIAEQSIGAAFVGCIAAAIVLSEPLRMFAGGRRYQVIGLSLRSPQYIQAVENEDPGPLVNPGFVTV